MGLTFFILFAIVIIYNTNYKFCLYLSILKNV
nr:MAG TPA: hypothetical protein [Bacteriophage sp.]